MAEQNESIAGLVRGLIADTRELVREELSLVRAEVREEILQAKAAAMSFAGAAVAGVIGVVLLCVAIGGAIAYAFGWPSWAGYGAVAVLLLIGAAVLAMMGRKEVANLRALPKSRETVKENVEWMQNKSVRR
jgi:fructose-specific phosphotransferase system IIC component